MIRNGIILAAAVGLLGALTVPARAQFTGYGVGGQYLLMNQSVRQELKLTEQQFGKIKTEVDKVLDANKDKLARLKDADPEERAPVLDAITEQTNKIVVGVLSKDQVKRLREIDLQQRGPMALYDPEVRKALKITEPQLAKLKVLAKETNQQAQKAQDAGDMKKLDEVMRAAGEKLDTLLTDEQKKTWVEMLGKPFEIKPDQM
jgi:hypothetical protein